MPGYYHLVPSGQNLSGTCPQNRRHSTFEHEDDDEDDYERYKTEKANKRSPFCQRAAWPEKDRPAAILPISAT